MKKIAYLRNLYRIDLVYGRYTQVLVDPMKQKLKPFVMNS